jgi:CRISPR-associated endonuclease/helicase Cas3
LKDLKPPEVVSDWAALFAECQRVRFEWQLDPKPTLASVAAEAVTRRQALMVLNTIRDARTAYQAAQQAAGDRRTVLHLSTGMCPAHRQAVLDLVRRFLDDDEPLLLVSTSLVEAGVDLDFPVAYRAVGPPESLAQVAGRCNREAALGDRGGLVVIFDPADGGYPPSYPTQIQKARIYFGPRKAGKAEPEDQVALDAYFQALYRTLGIEEPGQPAKVIASNRRRLDFLAVADGPLKAGGSTQRDRKLAFQMITEDTLPVVVRYGNTATIQKIDRWLDVLTGPRPDMNALRRLQPYIATMRRSTAERADVAANLAPVVGDLRVWRGGYDDGYGIVLEPRGEDFLL